LKICPGVGNLGGLIFQNAVDEVPGISLFFCVTVNIIMSSIYNHAPHAWTIFVFVCN